MHDSFVRFRLWTQFISEDKLRKKLVCSKIESILRLKLKSEKYKGTSLKIDLRYLKESSKNIEIQFSKNASIGFNISLRMSTCDYWHRIFVSGFLLKFESAETFLLIVRNFNYQVLQNSSSLPYCLLVKESFLTIM